MVYLDGMVCDEKEENGGKNISLKDIVRTERYKNRTEWKKLTNSQTDISFNVS